MNIFCRLLGIAALGLWPALAFAAPSPVPSGTFGIVGARVEVGDGTTLTRSLPVQVGTDADWRSVSVPGSHASGLAHSLGIKQDGSLWAWGSNLDGRLGIGTADDNAHTSPVLVSNVTFP